MNEGLRYACYIILRKLNQEKDHALSGTRFNKVMSLLHFHLKEGDYDIGLPHCWYLYGDETIPQELPREVHFEHFECPERTFVTWIGKDEPKFNLKSEETALIDTKAQTIIERYHVKGGTYEATDDVYENAPFEFQRDFRALREKFAFIVRYTYMSSNPQKNIFLGLFPMLFESFPREDFPAIRSHTSRYRVLANLLLNDDRDRLPEIQAITSEYWLLFCKFLRIHPLGHENVSSGRLKWWQRDAVSHLRIYDEWFSDEASRYLSERRLSEQLDPLDLVMLAPPDWGEGSEDASENIDPVVYG
jgi:hypothetical protein